MSFPFIATRDVAAYAAKRLLALYFKGHNVQYLLGNRDLSYNEIIRLYGKAIDKPELPYVEFSYSDMKDTIVSQWGTSENVAEMFVEFMQAMNEGQILSDVKRNAESTTPTSIEEFVPVFVQVYSNA